MAKSIRRKGSEWEIPRRVCGHIAPPLKGTRTGFNQQLRHRGATHINCHNVTKHFGATSSRWWGAIHLHGGMCGREHYLLERAALCRLERAAAPCGPAGRAHFFPRLLAWDDSTLKLVVTYDQAYLKLLIRAWILRPCQSIWAGMAAEDTTARHDCSAAPLRRQQLAPLPSKTNASPLSSSEPTSRTRTGHAIITLCPMMGA